jgi:chloride channel 3/4/5
MSARRHGRLRLPDVATTADDDDTSNTLNGYGTEHQTQYLSLPSSPTSYFRRQPSTMSRRPSISDLPDERSPLLGATTRSSRIRIHSAHGSPRMPNLSRNQSYAGTRPSRPGFCTTTLLPSAAC